jgi:hypothetical protein
MNSIKRYPAVYSIQLFFIISSTSYKSLSPLVCILSLDPTKESAFFQNTLPVPPKSFYFILLFLKNIKP